MTPQQRYYHKNKEKLLKESRERYAQNVESERERAKRYKKNNIERVKTRRNLAMKIKRQKDPNFKLRNNISRMVRRALQGNKSRLSFLTYVEYTMIELRKHLESLFEPWMSWNNWGTYNPQTWCDNDSSTWTWQIDHIIPQSKLPFVSMTDDNFKKCWALDNLCPLNSKTNISKGNK